MTAADSELIVVLTNMPDRSAALQLAETLVERRLAACVNVLGRVDSVYRWQGKIEHAEEVPVLIKTRRSLYAEVESAITAAHPYELPEVIAVPAILGLEAYTDWVAAETSIDIG